MGGGGGGGEGVPQIGLVAVSSEIAHSRCACIFVKMVSGSTKGCYISTGFK